MIYSAFRMAVDASHDMIMHIHFGGKGAKVT